MRNLISFLFVCFCYITVQAQTPSLVINGSDPSAVSLSWTKVTNAKGYIIEYWKNNEAFSFSKELSTTDTTYIFPTFSDSISFSVAARLNDGGIGTSSTKLKVVLPANGTIYAENRALNSLTVKWDKIKYATSYTVAVSQNSFSKVTTDTFLVIDNLMQATNYTVSVKTTYPNATTDYFDHKTASFSTALNPTVSISLGDVNGERAKFNLMAGNNGTGYIELSTDNFNTLIAPYNGKHSNGTPENQANEGSDNRVSSLTANTSYSVRVKFKTGKDSIYTNVLTFKTSRNGPTAIAATNVTSTSFTANWNATTNTDGYIVTYFNKSTNSIKEKYTTATALVIDGLTPNTEYLYALQGVTGTDTTIIGNSVDVKTKTVSGTVEVLKSQVKIYPTVVTDLLTIEAKDVVTITNVSVLNTNGNLISRGAIDSVDFSLMKKGAYYVVIETTDGSFTKKIIKQ